MLIHGKTQEEHDCRFKAVLKRLDDAGATLNAEKCEFSKKEVKFAGYCGGRVGLVVRALAFHQCGPGSISALGVICGLILFVLYSAMRGFPPGTPVFPSHQKPTFDLISFDL